MVMRVWRGWTTPAHAAAYESMLLHEIFPGIASKGIAGYRGISLARRDADAEVEFVTIMWFDSVADIKAFSGDDYETAVVLPGPRALLARFDAKSAHYDIVVPPPASVPDCRH